MKLFEIYTEENRKDVDFGIHEVYADSEMGGQITYYIQVRTSFVEMEKGENNL